MQMLSIQDEILFNFQSIFDKKIMKKVSNDPTLTIYINELFS